MKDDREDEVFIDDTELYEDDPKPDPNAREKAKKLFGYTDEMFDKLFNTGEITLTPEVQQMRDAPIKKHN
ncbi:MAG: hypothetical protein PHY47_16025 [Lachnospiraceae bacterium]|nr:hypothetical protein [Lachnospiraceae bacterium]